MILTALRALASLVGFVALLALAVAAIGLAVFSIQGGDEALSPANLASLLGLPELRETVGSWLASLEADGSVAWVAALCGAGALLLGAGLLTGALAPRRERLLIVEQDERGMVAMRSRACAAALTDLAERPRETVSARARVRPARRGLGGRARLRLVTRVGTDERPRAQRARADLKRVAEELSLSLKRSSRRTRRDGRVL